jgi:tRNA pseudouridine38-40 synthase
MPEKKERIALKIGYLGTNYHGFQIQPHSELRTVEGEFFAALKKLKIVEDRKAAQYSYAGRTDKGVHASAQVVSFVTPHPKVTPRMINSMLPNDIWAYAIAKPHWDFNARRDALSREYRYFLVGQSDVDIARMREASELFIGVHDFSNFSQKDGQEDINRIKEVKLIDIEKVDSLIVIDIAAHGFLRKMVRKIVSALRMVGCGIKDNGWVKDLLELRKTEQIEPAPASGLILKKVSFPNVTFEVDEYAKMRLTAQLKKELFFYATMAAVLDDMMNL